MYMYSLLQLNSLSASFIFNLFLEYNLNLKKKDVVLPLGAKTYILSVGWIFFFFPPSLGWYFSVLNALIYLFSLKKMVIYFLFFKADYRFQDFWVDCKGQIQHLFFFRPYAHVQYWFEWYWVGYDRLFHELIGTQGTCISWVGMTSAIYTVHVPLYTSWMKWHSIS